MCLSMRSGYSRALAASCAGCPPVFLCMSFYTTHLQTVCSQDVKDDGEPLLNHQLVLYSPPQFLQPFHEKEKRLVFGGREWVIEQDWESVGVAAVVWEPVSASLPSLLLSPSPSSSSSPSPSPSLVLSIIYTIYIHSGSCTVSPSGVFDL